MEKHRPDHHHLQHPKGRGRRKRRSGCCCSARVAVSSVCRGIGRCTFVACYPVIQCFGWDDCRHHHRHNHFH